MTDPKPTEEPNLNVHVDPPAIGAPSMGVQPGPTQKDEAVVKTDIKRQEKAPGVSGND